MVIELDSTEAPRVGDFLRIVFYKGNGEGNDVIVTEVIQTVKEGDTLTLTPLIQSLMRIREMLRILFPQIL